MTARSTIRLGIAFGAAIVTSVVSDRAADAADGDLLVQLEYSVAPACPDEAAFVRDVRARAPRFDVGAAASARSWRITARRDADSEGSFTGRIAMRDAGGRETVRDVSGATCREVIAALALIGALTVDAKPPASDAPPVSEPPLVSEPPPVPPPALPPPATPAPAPAPRPAPVPAPPTTEEPRSWQLGIGARADLHGDRKSVV